MLSCLDGAGWIRQLQPEDADLLIVNSCAFIESAKLESINTMLTFRKRFPQKKIILSGCLAQRYASELSKSMPEADAFLGVDDITKIHELAHSLFKDSPVNAARNSENNYGGRPLLSLPGQAYIKIAEGCNNHCSFCAIPSIRGRLRSRSIDDIYSEFNDLVFRGIKEICFVAQDLASYGVDIAGKCLLDDLLCAISNIKGDFWIRLLYLHPDHFPLSILNTIKKDSRILPYFDIPFQHASQPVLYAMNRSGTAAIYLELVKAIRAAMPDSFIRSTFLTGFPGETDADFNALLAFQKAAQIDWLGVFTYSREEETSAFDMKGRVSKKTAALRKSTLEEKQISITEKRLERLVGRHLTALVEEVVDEEEGLYLGRLYCQAPEVDGAAVIESGKKLEPGSFVQGKITGRAGFDLRVDLF